MLLRYCYLFLLVISLSAQAEDSVIRLENYETLPKLEPFDKREIEPFTDTTKQKSKLELGSLKSKLGPIETKLQFNPLAQQSQAQFNMDLIESYQFFKENHDPRKLLPYTIKSFQNSGKNIKELKSKVEKTSSELYKELKTDSNN